MSVQRNNAKKVSGEEVVAQSFAVKNSFVDPTGVNAVVLEGLTKDEIENFGEVVNVYPDLPVYSTAYSWGIDRIDQSSLPLSNTYTPVFKGCGVDIILWYRHQSRGVHTIYRIDSYCCEYLQFVRRCIFEHGRLRTRNTLCR